jgi:hypothetical protein
VADIVALVIGVILAVVVTEKLGDKEDVSVAVLEIVPEPDMVVVPVAATEVLPEKLGDAVREPLFDAVNEPVTLLVKLRDTEGVIESVAVFDVVPEVLNVDVRVKLDVMVPEKLREAVGVIDTVAVVDVVPDIVTVDVRVKLDVIVVEKLGEMDDVRVPLFDAVNEPVIVYVALRVTEGVIDCVAVLDLVPDMVGVKERLILALCVTEAVADTVAVRVADLLMEGVGDGEQDGEGGKIMSSFDVWSVKVKMPA